MDTVSGFDKEADTEVQNNMHFFGQQGPPKMAATRLKMTGCQCWMEHKMNTLTNWLIFFRSALISILSIFGFISRESGDEVVGVAIIYWATSVTQWLWKWLDLVNSHGYPHTLSDRLSDSNDSKNPILFGTQRSCWICRRRNQCCWIRCMNLSAANIQTAVSPCYGNVRCLPDATHYINII